MRAQEGRRRREAVAAVEFVEVAEKVAEVV